MLPIRLSDLSTSSFPSSAATARLRQPSLFCLCWGRAFTAALLTGALTLTTGCTDSTNSATTTETGSQAAEQTAANVSEDASSEEAADLPSASLPVLGTIGDFTLTDQTGLPTTQEELRGRISVAHFMFTTCRATCPTQMKALQNVASRLQDLSWDRYSRFVSISVDPADSPEALAAFAADYNEADDPRWLYLTGENAEVRRLCETGFHLPVGSNPSDAPDGPFVHSPKLVLIDPVGRIRGYYESSSPAEVTQLARDAEALRAEQLFFPPEIRDSPWLSFRADDQRQNIGDTVDHNFQLTDRRRESGIRFRHVIVDDSGRRYKGVHYDHGNGLAVADVDGDSFPDLYFVNQVGGNELWRNRGDGTFEDITDRSGTAAADRVSVGASFADFDNDGDADLVVTAVREGSLLYRNDGKGNFTNVTADSGFDDRGHPSGAIAFDYDRDGLLDLFVAHVGQYTTEEQGAADYYVGFPDAFSGHLKPNRTEFSRMYKNLGEWKFRDVTAQLGLEDGSWAGDAAFLDGNRDGWPDLYLLDMQGNDEYFENQNGERFVRRSRDVFEQTSWGAMGVGITDFDNDGDEDLFITDMHSDMSKDIMADVTSEASMALFSREEKDKATMQLPESLLQSEGVSLYGNTYFRNDGQDQFSEMSAAVNAENYWPWGLSVGDLNADRFEDVFIASSMNYPYRYQNNSLMLNAAGERFVDAEFVVGAEPRADGRTAVPWFVVDDASAEEESVRKMMGDRDSGIVWSSMGSRSSVIFDMDGDGDLDIVTSEFGDVPLVLENDLTDRRQVNRLELSLKGTSDNATAIGARVMVRVGDQSFLRLRDGRTGYLSQGILPMYIGLGQATAVDTLEITWPNGTVQTVEGPIPANKPLTITQPAQ